MDKKVEKFKSDFKDLNARVKLIKKKLRGIRKEAMSVAYAANSLYARGEETMYTEEGTSAWKVWTPKFSGLDELKMVAFSRHENYKKSRTVNKVSKI